MAGAEANFFSPVPTPCDDDTSDRGLLAGQLIPATSLWNQIVENERAI